MDLLDLEIFRTKGRTERAVEVQVVRPIALQDLEQLHEEKGAKTPHIKRLGERHHSLARNLAAGMPDWEASAITGYACSRISILKADPTFRELVAFYRDKIDKKFESMGEQIYGLGYDAIMSLREQMEDAPETIPTGLKVKIAEMAADRTGFGPSSNTNVNVNVGLAQRLDAARKRVQMIDVTPARQGPGEEEEPT